MDRTGGIMRSRWPGLARSVRIAVRALWMLACAVPAAAQSDLQLWGDYSLNGPLGHAGRSVWALDLEPQVLLVAPDGGPGWYSGSVTPAVEYAVRPWMDVTAEFGATYTRQTDGLKSLELTPRGGVRFYLLSRKIPVPIQHISWFSDLPSRRRVVVRDWFRVDARNLFYTGDEPRSHTVRLRNRLELLIPLNKPRTTDDRSMTLMSDWEWFIPLDDPAERFANRQRIRTGLAFRRSYEWRLQTLYVWTRSRDTTEEPFSTSDNAISVIVQRFYK